MELSEDQNQAKDMIMDWVKSADKDKWSFKLGGLAGTGKTTLVTTIAEMLSHEQAWSKKVHFCAPTGKATAVLLSKLKNISKERAGEVETLHKLIYKASSSGRGILKLLEELELDPTNKDLLDKLDDARAINANSKLYFAPIAINDMKGHLIICDEASMITYRMSDDLRQTGAKVLFVGDHFQLPPVAAHDWFGETEFDIKLEKIHRQAQESNIIMFAFAVRNGVYRPELQKHNDCRFITRQEFDSTFDPDKYQLLSGRNYVRRQVNRRARKYYGIENQLPRAGEKLICLKNKIHEGRKDGKQFDIPFKNGVICYATKDAMVATRFSHHMSVKYGKYTVPNIHVYNGFFNRHYRKNDLELSYNDRKDWHEFEWGYCITVHKSQGSEFDNVLLIDDELQIGSEEMRYRWLYTAITRAKENLVITRAG